MARSVFTARKPLFPGYLFVDVPPDAGRWRSLNSTYGVARMVSLDARAPTEVPRGLVEEIQARCDDDGCLVTPDILHAGDRVRVVEGPFARMIAQIEAVDDNARIFVLLDLMGQKVRTEVKARSVERL